jgi:hypothetical protein
MHLQSCVFILMDRALPTTWASHLLSSSPSPALPAVWSCCLAGGFSRHVLWGLAGGTVLSSSLHMAEPPSTPFWFTHLECCLGSQLSLAKEPGSSFPSSFPCRGGSCTSYLFSWFPRPRSHPLYLPLQPHHLTTCA